MPPRLAVVVLSLCTISAVLAAVDPDVTRNALQLIASRGYPSETHGVTTPDGFQLTIFRLPRPTGIPVFLQHGLMDSADSWLINTKNQSLAYVLFDAGYDVWIGNSRANRYSKNNIYYSDTQAAYWSWDWDTMAQQDIPVSLEYIAGVNRRTKIVYIGHSQGGTIGLVSQILDSSVEQHMQLQILLAPVTYLAKQTSPLFKALSFLHADSILSLIGDKNFNPTTETLRKLLGVACDVTRWLCTNVLQALFGKTRHTDPDRMGVYLAHWPDSTSVRNMIHWIRNARIKDFVNSHGSPLNTTMAGVSTIIFSGDNDALADPEDVGTLVSKLGQRVLYYGRTDYSHMDFIWAKDTPVLYAKLLSLLVAFAR